MVTLKKRRHNAVQESRRGEDGIMIPSRPGKTGFAVARLMSRPIEKELKTNHWMTGCARVVPEQSVTVWDLETVPDLSAAARMLDLGDAPAAEVREALGAGFPKYPLHKIACIGALIASRQPEGWRVDALGAPHTGDRSEAQLINDFVEKIGQLRPQLITFNGHSFDLPVLRYRAMVDRIAAAGLQVRPYFYRYGEDALDLCDVLGSYVPGAKVKLDEVSKILGLTGKPEGVDGGRVEEMVLAGQMEEVARYCESDVLNTYRVWLVYELFRGSITAGEHDWSEAQIRDFVSSRKTANPHLSAAVGIVNHGNETLDLGGRNAAE